MVYKYVVLYIKVSDIFYVNKIYFIITECANRYLIKYNFSYLHNIMYKTNIFLKFNTIIFQS